MPANHSIRLADSPSLRIRIIGIPPATDASKAILHPFVPRHGEQLIAVLSNERFITAVTCLPWAIAVSISVLRLGAPMSSTRISTSGFWRLQNIAGDSHLLGGAAGIILAAPHLHYADFTTSAGIDLLPIALDYMLNVPEPTVPKPHIPILTVFNLNLCNFGRIGQKTATLQSCLTPVNEQVPGINSQT